MRGKTTRAKMSILALPWVRQVNIFRWRSQQRVSDGTDVDSGAADEVGATIGGEGVAARDGVPEEAGEGHRDGDGDDLAELLRE